MQLEAKTQAPAARTTDEDVARIVVAGHVDHGKSTLIGRLMYDLGLLHQSKIDEVIASSARRGVATEWSYVLDSLQEERDQAVTIDTTRIWFTHRERRYTIIDAPGHRQFLANMLSGASEADAAILVVDAAAGIGEQTLRHAYLLAFLGITNVIVAVNKIDLLDDPQPRFAALERDVRAALHRTPPVAVIPISATLGDNVATRGASTPWYAGPTIVDAIEAVRRVAPPVARPFRFAVQDVYRRGTERIVAGTVGTGSVSAGDELVLLSAGVRVRAERLVRWPDGEVAGAEAGESVGIVLDGDRFVGRGDTLAPPNALPAVAKHVAVETFWLDLRGPLQGERLRLKRGTQDVPVVVEGTPSAYDIEAARELGGAGDAQHNIVRLQLRATMPIVFDPREADAHGARSVLLRGGRVVAIGFTIAGAAHGDDEGSVTLGERERRTGHRASIVWLTGLSGAGKSTLARAAERRLFDRGIPATVIDGDLLRGTLNTDLGFSAEDRAESVRRAAAVAGILAESGQIAIVSLISPFAADRNAARALARHPFFEVYVNAPLATCEARDPKGLYKRARLGELRAFTGIDSPYEPPAAPD
ncbi:MAG TPA: adenylyl-sulfate kinase, partial [Candidatus Elarobacter sp.]